jgi:hypothetical protein
MSTILDLPEPERSETQPAERESGRCVSWRLTKGQRAMAVAMIHPDSDNKGGSAPEPSAVAASC